MIPAPCLPTGDLLDEATRRLTTSTGSSALALAVLIPFVLALAAALSRLALRRRRPGEGEDGRECPALAPGSRQASPDGQDRAMGRQLDGPGARRG